MQVCFTFLQKLLIIESSHFELLKSKLNGLHLYSAFIQSAVQFMPLIHPFTLTFTHQRRLAAMQGTNQLVRSNWGLGVLLRDTLTRLGWDRTSNQTARRQLLPPEPHRPRNRVLYFVFPLSFRLVFTSHSSQLRFHSLPCLCVSVSLEPSPSLAAYSLTVLVSPADCHFFLYSCTTHPHCFLVMSQGISLSEH